MFEKAVALLKRLHQGGAIGHLQIEYLSGMNILG
jgi:hypothetical protein